ncbi:MAG: hypothetical protein EOO78_10445 [Oxalobacteraceae bacterium]|nr:MAG: hypothetical protein EOO78_10445 [Oxalobacteraceae bacterium]
MPGPTRLSSTCSAPTTCLRRRSAWTSSEPILSAYHHHRGENMTLDRRGFLGAVPIASLALASGRAQAQYASASAAASAPAAAAAPVSDYDTLVQLSGDALPRNTMAEPARLQALLDMHAKPVDGYLLGGAVAELEAKFSALLGKEDTVFMPTGTLANHLALRLLCGEAKHALVQQESHVYRDESNAVTTLSGINLVPLAPGRAAPTLDEVGAAIERAELGPYPIKVGAIALESPVRRAQGATLAPCAGGRYRAPGAREEHPAAPGRRPPAAHERHAGLRRAAVLRALRHRLRLAV